MFLSTNSLSIVYTFSWEYISLSSHIVVCPLFNITSVHKPERDINKKKKKKKQTKKKETNQFNKKKAFSKESVFRIKYPKRSWLAVKQIDKDQNVFGDSSKMQFSHLKKFICYCWQKKEKERKW